MAQWLGASQPYVGVRALVTAWEDGDDLACCVYVDDFVHLFRDNLSVLVHEAENAAPASLVLLLVDSELVWVVLVPCERKMDQIFPRPSCGGSQRSELCFMVRLDVVVSICPRLDRAAAQLEESIVENQLGFLGEGAAGTPHWPDSQLIGGRGRGRLRGCWHEDGEGEKQG